MSGEKGGAAGGPAGPGPLGRLAGRTGLWGLVLIVLGLWLAEALHYAVVAGSLHGLSGLGLLAYYARVAVFASVLAATRWLLYMGAVWLFAWLLGLRGLDGRRALVAAAYTAPAHALVALAATPAWLLSGGGGRAGVLVVVASYYSSMAAAAAALAWAVRRITGGGWGRAAAAAALSALLVGLPPAAMLTPGFNVYSVVLYVLQRGQPAG